ncbi:MAG: hypothetical protein RLZZ367_866 [Bacteroidota bacterium]|jgi:Ca2+-transporting ATPase
MKYTGITTKEANEKLLRIGYNELPSARPKNVFRIALEVIKEPMFLLLIGCGGLYMLLGDYKEGVVLLSSILLIISITFYQYRKTEKALQALKQLSSPRAVVIRDSIETRIPGREIVPDDIVILNEGDRVPADAELLETTNLQIDESILTGESHLVSKYAAEGHNSLYSGTLVVQGRCICRVTQVGMQSQLGKIAAGLNSVKDDQTRLQKEMKQLIRRFAITGIATSIVVIIAFYISRGNILESILSGLASSMAILPEEFPVVFTVFMALGAWRLSKNNVLTRKPSAIETLGSATVLCSDKTGTITQNKMEIAAIATPLSYAEGLLSSTTQPDILNVIQIARLASQEETIDPMDNAITTMARALNIEKSEGPLIAEYPLSHQLLAVTRIYKQNDHTIYGAAKGAPETIFKLCRLSDAEIEQQAKHMETMARAGLRVLGIAGCTVEAGKQPTVQTDYVYTFKGLLAFEDPIRPEVPQAVKDCQTAGIRVIMITGDHPATATTIAMKAGIKPGEVITGDKLSLMSDEELKTKIGNTNVFARIAPEHKLRIVRAFKANGEIVAMTGDGVNDAPALKAADIGIAMGIKGTDVAREASSLVLVDDNFASIVTAIRLGRRIFDNMQKAMSYIIAIHIPIIVLTLLPAFIALLPMLLLPLHIVFMELIIDPVCSVAFEAEQEELGIMNRPPRDINSRFFGLKRMGYSALQGLFLLSAVLVVYFITIKEGHTDGEIRAITFSSLIIGNIFLILTNLSNTRSFISVLAERNRATIVILLAAVVLLLLIISIPVLRSLFSFEYPGYSHFIISIMSATGMLIVLEGIKYFKQKKNLQ